MKFYIGDKYFVDGVEGVVKFINAHGHALLFPLEDGMEWRGERLFIGCAFAEVNKKGRLKDGTKAIYINESKSGAV